MPAPDLTAVKAYLGSEVAFTDDEITSALAAEAKAQARACRVPAPADPWPADLSEALCRRVARNLAVRAVPLGYQPMAGDYGVTAFRVGNDSEVRRLEGPWRKWVVG